MVNCFVTTCYNRILSKFTWYYILPPWNLDKLASASDVEVLTPEEMKNAKHVVVWAWIDEVAGIVRAHTFAADWDITEDEANGSGAMKLAMSLGREVTVYHGKGSIIHARPSKEAGKTEVGGFVVIAKRNLS